MKTYLIETIEGNQVIEYFTTLKEAKNSLLESETLRKKCCILMLQGPRFGEGFHKYRIFIVNNKFKYERY